MKAVVAMDSFKGSLSSLAAGEAVKAGILRADPGAEVLVRPLADGGEGTVEALIAGLGGERRVVRVTGPMGESVDCAYGVVGDLAVLEMAASSGLTLVPQEKRDPFCATTFGVGQAIADAIARGCRRFLIGIGGSATNDGGAGMLQALGFGLLDESGAPIPPGAAGLEKLRTIETAGALPQLKDCRFRIACDVTNPLCGENGASAVFGPQKGAKPEDVPRLDALLARFAALSKAVVPEADDSAPGTGAAGGLGFAFRTFLAGELEPGVQIVLEETRLAEALEGADVAVTGEGRLDGQTTMGKAPVGVARLAKSKGCLTLALAGGVTREAGACNAAGIDAFFPAVRGVCTLEEAMDPGSAWENLAGAAEQAFRLLRAALARQRDV